MTIFWLFTLLEPSLPNNSLCSDYVLLLTWHPNYREGTQQQHNFNNLILTDRFCIFKVFVRGFANFIGRRENIIAYRKFTVRNTVGELSSVHDDFPPLFTSSIIWVILSSFWQEGSHFCFSSISTELQHTDSSDVSLSINNSHLQSIWRNEKRITI